MYISNVCHGKVNDKKYMGFDLSKNLMKKATVYIHNDYDDDKFQYHVYVRAYSTDESLNKDYYSDLVKMIDEMRENYYEVVNFFLSIDSVLLFNDESDQEIEYKPSSITIDDGYYIQFKCQIDSFEDLIDYLDANSLDNNKPKKLTLENKS